MTLRKSRIQCENLLLQSLTLDDQSLLAKYVYPVTLSRGRSIFEPGDEVTHVVFPCDGTMIALVILLPDGAAVEAAMVGREGAAGGVIGFGGKPAFARGLVQIAGPAVRIPVDVLSDARNESTSLQESFAAYSDCFLAQVLQSVACNAVHALVERCCRWLLVAQDRFAMDEMPLTQEFLAETLGVQRTTVTEVMRSLQDQQIVTYHRGRIRILDRIALEAMACQCYGAVRDHFERVMPGVYPQYSEGRRKS